MSEFVSHNFFGQRQGTVDPANIFLSSTACFKNITFFILLNTPVKKLILIVFGTQHPEQT